MLPGIKKVQVMSLLIIAALLFTVVLCTVANPVKVLAETHTLIVKQDGTGDFLSPKLANDSITSSSANNQYIILVYPGVYTDKEWVVKPHTTIRGTDRDTCWLKGENPASATNVQISNQSTLWLKPTANLENLTITCKNMRYPVHSEDSGRNVNAVHNVTNCHIEHYGNLEAVQYRQAWIDAHPGEPVSPDLDPNQVWGGASGIGSHAWGYGSASGVVETFANCSFISKNDGWYVHNREDFTNPQINTINSSTIASTVLGTPITVQSLGSGTEDECIFNNCELIGTYIVQNDKPWITQDPAKQYADHTDYTVTLNGCTPIGYKDENRGRALAIFSNSTGSSSYVKVSGSAVSSILGNYVTRDGGGTLKGYIYGYWDISGILVGINNNITVDNTLGRRLGNCTSTNKTLIVTFEDGATKTVTFNENYTSQSNAYVISKINSVLGSSGTAAEYNVTKSEYYPEVPDKQLILTNNTSIGIPRFAAVCFNTDNTNIRLMKATDPVGSFLGITLEGIAPGQSGKVLTEGIMHKEQLNGFTGNIAVGTQISISSVDGCFAINAGNPIVLEGVKTDWAYFKRKDISPTPTPTPGGVTVYEAEAGTLGGAANIVNSSNASGGQAVSGMTTVGSYVQVGNVNGGSGGTNTLVIRYSCAYTSNKSLSLYVNGVDVQQVIFAPTGSWDTFQDKTVNISLNADTGNTIKLQLDASDAKAVNVDNFTLNTQGGATPTPTPTSTPAATSTPMPTFTPTPAPGTGTVYEAEAGTRGGAATIVSSPNASGGQAVGGMTTVGSYVQVGNVDGGSGGTKTLVIRYSCAYTSNKSLSLYVNGVDVGQMIFTPTGSWDTFQDKTVNIALNAGTENTVKLQLDASDAKTANIDKLTVN